MTIDHNALLHEMLVTFTRDPNEVCDFVDRLCGIRTHVPSVETSSYAERQAHDQQYIERRRAQQREYYARKRGGVLPPVEPPPEIAATFDLSHLVKDGWTRKR